MYLCIHKKLSWMKQIYTRGKDDLLSSFSAEKLCLSTPETCVFVDLSDFFFEAEHLYNQPLPSLPRSINPSVPYYLPSSSNCSMGRIYRSFSAFFVNSDWLELKHNILRTNLNISASVYEHYYISASLFGSQ